MSRAGLGEKIRWVLRHEGVFGLISKILLRIVRPRLFKKPPAYNWTKFTPSESELASMRNEVAHFAKQPLISILLPVYNPEPKLLRETLLSVSSQIYENWELCIADDASTNPEIKEILQKFEESDKRIKVCYRKENGHISKSSNSALELATGEFLALLDHDDLLAPQALFAVVKFLQANEGADIVYSNEDKIDLEGLRSEPAFKPAWSPEYFLSFMYIGHLTVYRSSLVKEAGGFRAGFEGSQDYDLALRVTEKTDKIFHIPDILYHWRKHENSVSQNIHAKPYAFESGKRAIREAIERRGFKGGDVSDTIQPGIYQARFPVLGKPSVGVVVVGDGNINIDRLKYLYLEVRKVSSADEVSSRLERIHSEIGKLTTDYVLVLDSRLQIQAEDLVERMLEHAQREGVGAVGGRILTPAGDYIHAGYLVFGGSVFHNFYGTHRAHEGYGAKLTTVNNVSALSLMCCMAKRETWLESACFRKGFDNLVSAELDFCFSLRNSGKRIVFTPYAACKLSGDVPPRSQNLEKFSEDFALLDATYGISCFRDPFYPYGLDTSRAQYELEEGR